MKKVIVSLFALACVVILLVGCGLCVEPAVPEPVAPNVRPPSIMVDDTIYIMSGDRDNTVSSDEISEDDILGEIDSEIPLSEMPEENGQTNLSGQGLLGAPYAQYRNDMVVLKNGKWIVFEKLSELRSRLIVDLQAKYDLHIREVMRLRVEDLDVDTGRLKVYDASYEELDRVLSIQPEHLDLFEEWAEQRKEYERLFYHK